MGCFPCFSAKKKDSNDEEAPISHPKVCNNKNVLVTDSNHKEEASPVETTAKTFNFRELATATKNFRHECLLGEGGFGRIYKGKLYSSGEIVAVRQLDRNGTIGSKEFQVEVLLLSLLQHPNLVKMIGYCADGDQRLLVYQHLPLGSLKKHLFGVSGEKRPLDWSTRMKIAAGIAQGLEYLHEKVNPPIIYRYLRSSNILLDETNTPKLSEYGLAKLLQSSSRTNALPRITSAYGYCAPEYERCGELTLKSDVYSFGVVLLELITGRRAFESERPTEEQNIVSWAQSFFGNPKRYPDMADPLLRNEFPASILHQAVGVASMCLQEEPSVRPLITDVATALSFLAMPRTQARTDPRIVPVPCSGMDSFQGLKENHDLDGDSGVN